MSNVSFYELEKNVYKIVCELGCEILKNILETQDKKLMVERNKREYRHKGYKNNTIKTIMGEVEFKRAVYIKDNKSTYLLDNSLSVNTYGKISANLAEVMLKTVVDTISYRKGAEEIRNLTNETISHEGLRNIVYKLGSNIEDKENKLVDLYKHDKLYEVKKEIPALFEEADGIWLNLQGKDRNEYIDNYKEKCLKEGKTFDNLYSVKSELKLYVMYEGWDKTSNRHNLVNKEYIAGFMTPKALEKIRNAKVYSKYNVNSIKLRVLNGDGARWIKNICTKDTIYQKDNFHIHQEIIRSIDDEEYQNKLLFLLNNHKYSEIPFYIESLKYILGGEESSINKLNSLNRYLKDGLPRYKEVAKEIPKAPDGLEYRDMGTMESQIFSVLKVKLCSGRKSWSKKGANYISKICAIYSENNGNIEIEKIEDEIPIDNSVYEYINNIEQNILKNKFCHYSNNKLKKDNYLNVKILKRDPKIVDLLRLSNFSDLIYR